MKKLMVYMGCIFFLLLTACSAKEESVENTYKLYYINKEETKLVTEGYTPAGDSKEELVEDFIHALKQENENTEYQTALPSDVEVLGYSFGEAGQLILNFSPSYYTVLTGIREILARAAYVKTFCQIDEIENVEFNVNGQPLNLTGDMPVSTMMKKTDFIENTGQMSGFSQNAYVTIYFSNIAGTGLLQANREVDYDGIMSVEQLIIEQLIAGPVEGEYGMIATLPEGTMLNSITTQDGICYVDFNEEFLKKLSDVSEQVTIYSVVNSLVEQSNINKVQFLINGEKQKVYQTLTFDGLFERNLDIIVGEQ